MSLPAFVAGLDSVLLFKIGATLVALIAYLVSRFACNRAIERIAAARRMHPRRAGSTRRAIGIVAVVALMGVLAVVWSIDFRSLALASGAALAALGIAFFAQWSVLSHVTTSIIMFWRFPIHIGDRIGLLDDRSFSGIVTDLTPFFIILEDDDGNTITIPNTMSLLRAFVIYNPDAPEQAPRSGRTSAATAGGRYYDDDMQDAV